MIHAYRNDSSPRDAPHGPGLAWNRQGIRAQGRRVDTQNGETMIEIIFVYWAISTAICVGSWSYHNELENQSTDLDYLIVLLLSATLGFILIPFMAGRFFYSEYYPRFVNKGAKQ